MVPPKRFVMFESLAFSWDAARSHAHDMTAAIESATNLFCTISLGMDCKGETAGLHAPSDAGRARAARRSRRFCRACGRGAGDAQASHPWKHRSFSSLGIRLPTWYLSSWPVSAGTVVAIAREV